MRDPNSPAWVSRDLKRRAISRLVASSRPVRCEGMTDSIARLQRQ